MADDYDTPWKDALTRYFPDFLHFYFPAAHAAIDWSRPYAFLDAELAALAHDSTLRCRIADKLVQVHTLAGGEQWVLVHIEVQAQRDSALAERIFAYNYRTFDRYRRPVASLVVLADGGRRWRPNHFGYTLFGSTMRFDFAVAKLLDYTESELVGSDNPFAIVTLAHQQTAGTRHAAEARAAAKWRLTKLLFERNWNKKRIFDLYLVVDWLMALPPAMEKSFWDRVVAYAKEKNMAWISNGERFGMEAGLKEGLKIGREQGRKEGKQEGRDEGREEGRQEGREEGREEGRKQAAADLVIALLQGHFGPLPNTTQARLRNASVDQLSAWAQAVLKAQTLEDVFR